MTMRPIKIDKYKHYVYFWWDFSQHTFHIHTPKHIVHFPVIIKVNSRLWNQNVISFANRAKWAMAIIFFFFVLVCFFLSLCVLNRHESSKYARSDTVSRLDKIIKQSIESYYCFIFSYFTSSDTLINNNNNMKRLHEKTLSSNKLQLLYCFALFCFVVFCQLNLRKSH